eukprot:m.187708 g.187708  ORF g.187708 m.187708 type:complete len:61 (-) comp17526_c4_seq2:752-934(-)
MGLLVVEHEPKNSSSLSVPLNHNGLRSISEQQQQRQQRRQRHSVERAGADSPPAAAAWAS